MNAFGDTTKLWYWTIRNQNKKGILNFLHREKVNVNEKDENGDTVLHLIFQNEDMAEGDIMMLLKIFLDRGSDPNIKNNKELTALHLAVARRYKKAVEFLMNRNAKMGVRDSEGNSIAHFFVEDESKKFSKLLKLRGSHSKKIKSYELLPFLGSIRKPINEVEKKAGDSTVFIQWLIEKGFDFKSRNKKGKSALHLCIEYELEHILHVLLFGRSQHLSTDAYNNALLHLFFEKNNQCKREDCDDTFRKNLCPRNSRYVSGIVKWMIDQKFSLSPIVLRDRMSLGMVSSAAGEESIMDMLVDHFLKSCPENGLATTVFLELMKSCAWKNYSKLDCFFEILRSLIAKGADVNAKDWQGASALYNAFVQKNQRAVEFLNDHGADFSVVTNNNENLFHALAKGLGLADEPEANVQEKLFELLASKGCCNVNAKANSGGTPLHLASLMENLTIVRKLIEHGAEINSRDTRDQQTPLHLAAPCNRAGKVAELLLESGADVNSKDNWGYRPLFLAADSGREATVSMLLKWGAYVNTYSADESPLFMAIRRHCFQNAREMLKYGADINSQGIVNLIRESEVVLPGVTDSNKVREKFLLSHWIKLKAAGLPCSREYETFAKCAEYQTLYYHCLKELETMKATFIDSRTSIFAFLHMHFDRRRVYVNNEQFKNLVESPELEQQFPNYSVVILASYRETVVWKSLLEPAKRAWLQLTNVILLDECVERIFAYLKNEDLIRMIECDKNA